MRSIPETVTRSAVPVRRHRYRERHGQPWSMLSTLNGCAVFAMILSVLIHAAAAVAQFATAPYLALLDGVMIVGCAMCVLKSVRQPCPRSWSMGISMGLIMVALHWVVMQKEGHNSSVGGTVHHASHGTDISGGLPSSNVAGLAELHSALIITVVIAIGIHLALIALQTLRTVRSKAGFDMPPLRCPSRPLVEAPSRSPGGRRTR